MSEEIATRPAPSGGNFITNTFRMIQNEIETRTAFIRRWFTPGRNIEDECGHPYEVSNTDMKRAFLRGDVARRIVTLYPEESWESPPDIYETEEEDETEFEKAWKELDKRFQLCAFFLRADILSGIGRFGVILLGIDDGLELSAPVAGVDLKTGGPVKADPSAPPTVGIVNKPTRQLLYVRCFDETFVTIKTLNADARNPRFGMPEMYSIQFNAEAVQNVGGTQIAGATPGISSPGSTMTRDVHWTRIIHLADNRLNNDIYGAPRMEVVYNRVLDLKKITGGSGEMFWKGGFPGISLESGVPADGTPVQFDKEATKDEMEKYMSGMQRFIALIGMQAKSLTVNIADPTPHILAQMQMITIALSCPMRVFMGSEQAQLASGQDNESWNDRMMRRQDTYITPFVLMPFIVRLQAIGILPAVAEEKGVQVYWEDMNAPSKTDRATYSTNQTSAFTKYLQAGGDTLIPPFQYLTLIMGLTEEEAHACIDEAEKAGNLIATDPEADHQHALEMIDAKTAAAAALGGNGNGKPGGGARFQQNAISK